METIFSGVLLFFLLLLPTTLFLKAASHTDNVARQYLCSDQSELRCAGIWPGRDNRKRYWTAFGFFAVPMEFRVRTEEDRARV